MEETYHVLQAQIEALKTEHATHMSIMASDTARYRKHHAEMCDKVRDIVIESQVTSWLHKREIHSAYP